MSGPQRTVNWNRALDAVAKYRPVVDVSGLVEVDAQIPQGVDAEANELARSTGTRRATGFPLRAMTISSPASARSTSWESFVFASCMPIWAMPSA